MPLVKEIQKDMFMAELVRDCFEPVILREARLHMARPEVLCPKVLCARYVEALECGTDGLF